MNSVQDLIKRFFTKAQPLPHGTYQYQAPPAAEKPFRLHLRLEPDGNGILLVNASTVLHLNQTAAEYAYHLVNQTLPDEVAKSIARRYNVSPPQALADFSDLSERINILIHTEDLDPVTYLGFERDEPYSRSITAPYRLDCALTYRTSSGIESDAPTDRVKRELLTEEWVTIMRKAWDAGIPHLIFTGGEPTLRPDLVELITEAERLGQVTGLITDGLRLSEHQYLEKILQAGLDHVLIVLNPDMETSWEAIRDTIPEDISLAVHLTMTPRNKDDFTNMIDRLAAMGVQALSVSTSDPALNNQLEAVQAYLAGHGIKLIWDLPVPYSHQHPVAIELAQSGEAIDGAGKAWLYVEPDGDVLPGQGILKVLGNLLNDPWQQIWDSARKS